FHNGVDGDDMLVPDRGGGPRLAEKTLSIQSKSRELRRNHLESDDTMQNGIERLENDASPAAAEFLEDFIMIEFAQMVRLGGRIEKIERHVLDFFDLILRRYREQRHVAEFLHRLPQRLAVASLAAIQIAI